MNKTYFRFRAVSIDSALKIWPNALINWFSTNSQSVRHIQKNSYPMIKCNMYNFPLLWYLRSDLFSSESIHLEAVAECGLLCANCPEFWGHTHQRTAGHWEGFVLYYNNATFWTSHHFSATLRLVPFQGRSCNLTTLFMKYRLWCDIQWRYWVK